MKNTTSNVSAQHASASVQAASDNAYDTLLEQVEWLLGELFCLTRTAIYTGDDVYLDPPNTGFHHYTVEADGSRYRVDVATTGSIAKLLHRCGWNGCFSVYIDAGCEELAALIAANGLEPEFSVPVDRTTVSQSQPCVMSYMRLGTTLYAQYTATTSMRKKHIHLLHQVLSQVVHGLHAHRNSL